MSPVDQADCGSISATLFFTKRLLGPHHMSPSTGLAQFPRSHLATLFFKKISMCSYEKAGVFTTEFSLTELEIFPMWTLQDETFPTAHGL